MLTVVYYTSTNFLESCIETIQCIKNEVNLHVLIEITNHSKKSTIVNVENLNKYQLIENPENILGNTEWKMLEPYFKETSSIHFVVHKNKRSYSFQTLYANYKLGKYLKKLNFDIIHFDTISNRSIGLYPIFKNKKVIITLHDHAPHSGENSWKENIANFIFYKVSKGFIFYSKYSKNQFLKTNEKLSTPLYDIKLQPYSYYQKNISKVKIDKNNFILFFGRLSYYKGIDILIESIPLILKNNPTIKFIIIGRSVYNYVIDKNILKKYKNNLTVVSEYMPNDQLVNYIKSCEFIVCPYRDASQSGVLMTAKAIGKIVIATNVGSFKEYINNEFDGIICEPTINSFSYNVNETLKSLSYKIFEKNINKEYSNKDGESNSATILKAYNTI